MNIAAGTNRGMVREINEDSFSTIQLNENVCCLIIADGMGGHKAGQIASGLACSVITNHIKEVFESNGINDENACCCLVDAISIANKKLYSDQLADESLSGMGTTVVAAIVTENNIHICSAGDSRLYVVDGRLKQITKDHSYVQDLLDKGLITGEEAVSHPNKNIITRAVGTEFNIDTDYFVLPKGNITRLIMCTDGLTNFVSDSEIENILINNDAQKANRILIDLANNNGGKDNITVINVDFDEVKNNDDR